jgi:hypothetical protein
VASETTDVIGKPSPIDNLNSNQIHANRFSHVAVNRRLPFACCMESKWNSVSENECGSNSVTCRHVRGW